MRWFCGALYDDLSASAFTTLLAALLLWNGSISCPLNLKTGSRRSWSVWDSPVMAPLNLSFNLDSLSGSLWIFDTCAWSWRRLLTSFFSPSVYRKNRETHARDEWILNRTVAETEPRELVLRTCSSLMFCSTSDQSIAVCSLKATELRATVFSRVNPALHH